MVVLELTRKMPEPPTGYRWEVELCGYQEALVALVPVFEDIDDMDGRQRLVQHFDYEMTYPFPTAERAVMAAGHLIQRLLCGREVERLTGVPVTVK
jgi:hypothetical protein